MATVILLNPYGTDVTNFINGTALVPQLLKGTVMAPGDTLYTLPYNYYASSLANIESAVALLDAKIRSTTGPIKVFGYSEGCQIADLWISDNYADATVTSLPLSFLSVGNADRKFGGFAYGQSAFSSVGYNSGLPATVPWPYVDFARQYDFVADFPTSQAIRTALGGVSGALNTTAEIVAAFNDIAAVMNDEDEQMAALNAIDGLEVVHPFYENVSPADAGNVWFTDTNGVQYGLSPTYPVPLLGIATLSPATDKTYRAEIETQYDRPFTLVPGPDYSALTPTVFTLADAFESGPGYLTAALGGTITDGNPVVPISYPNWTIFETQVESGAEILNSAITSTDGPKVVLGHGLGAVVASNWLRNYGPGSTVPAADLSFALIGNAVRLYGGLLNAQNGIDWFFPNSYPVPADTPYVVQDLSRQYDGWADYPQLTGNGTDNTWAILNALSGEGNVHPYYNNVTLNDAANAWYTPLQPPSGLTATASVSTGTFAAATYYYRVTATNSLGETTGSNEASAIVVTNGSVGLAWTVDQVSATDVKIYRGTAPGEENVLVATVAATATTYLDTGAAGTSALVPAANTAQGNISFGWSPTWPLPIYGTAQNATTQVEDNELRGAVEAAYGRPVPVEPNYPGSPYTQTVGLTGIASAAAYGTATVAIGVREILPDGVPTDGLFGETWVWFVGTITPHGIESAEAFGNLRIPFPADVLPTPMATDARVGTPTVS